MEYLILDLDPTRRIEVTECLNAHASEGWKINTSHVLQGESDRPSLIVILERKRGEV
jgi:hypothetical protein